MKVPIILLVFKYLISSGYFVASCDLIGQIKVNGTKKIPIIGIKKIPTLFSQNIKTRLQGDCDRQLVHEPGLAMLYFS